MYYRQDLYSTVWALKVIAADNLFLVFSSLHFIAY